MSESILKKAMSEDENLKGLILRALCNVLRAIQTLDDILPEDLVIDIISNIVERLCQEVYQ